MRHHHREARAEARLYTHYCSLRPGCVLCQRRAHQGPLSQRQAIRRRLGREARLSSGTLSLSGSESIGLYLPNRFSPLRHTRRANSAAVAAWQASSLRPSALTSFSSSPTSPTTRSTLFRCVPVCSPEAFCLSPAFGSPALRRGSRAHPVLARQVKEVWLRFDPTMESGGMDEGYLDITDYMAEHEMSAEEVVQLLRKVGGRSSARTLEERRGSS